ncbi:DNA mismatch repair protein [Ceratobasidium sp. 392]|nr:DNA mismatch repair protein [Ceratobasidium sp. 392]
MSFGDIQRAVEKCFAASGFSRFASDELDGPHNGRCSPRKVEKKPIYVLNLSISPSQVDNFVEPAKSMVQFRDTNRVLAFVLEVISRFLDKNNLSVQSRHVESNLGSPRKRVRREGTQPSLTSSQRNHATPSASGMQAQAPDLLATASPRVARDLLNTDKPQPTFDDSGYFEWTDPSSGDSFLVDSNTGNSFPRNRLPEHIQDSVYTSAEDNKFKNTETSSVDRRSLKPSHPELELLAEKSHIIPEWLTKAMQRNPIFQPTEQSIFSTGAIASDAPELRPQAHTCTYRGNVSTSNLSQSSKPTSDTFSAGDLKNAQVVAQVDTKFIACLLQRPDRTLALIDQHAADERVRVEKYLKRLCFGFLRGEVDVLPMNRPKQALLTRREAEILQRPGALDSLEKWGLWLELSAQASQKSHSAQVFEFIQVDVTGVPDVVASKLTTERELSTFIRSMVAIVEADEATSWPVASSDIQDEKDWVKALRYCPAPLLELVTSKACRGSRTFSFAYIIPD